MEAVASQGVRVLQPLSQAPGQGSHCGPHRPRPPRSGGHAGILRPPSWWGDAVPLCICVLILGGHHLRSGRPGDLCGDPWNGEVGVRDGGFPAEVRGATLGLLLPQAAGGALTSSASPFDLSRLLEVVSELKTPGMRGRATSGEALGGGGLGGRPLSAHTLAWPAATNLTGSSPIIRKPVSGRTSRVAA